MAANHERQPNDNTDLIMLRSDLSDLFRSHADLLAFRQPNDFEQPTEVVLGGTCQRSDPNRQNQERDYEVHIRQRIDDMGTDYLIIAGIPGDYAWCRIADNYACELSRKGDAPLTSKSIDAVRLFINPTITKFTSHHSALYAAKSGLYETADQYTNKDSF